MLHRIWQHAGMTPSAVLALPEGERAFLFASEVVQMEFEAKHPQVRL